MSVEIRTMHVKAYRDKDECPTCAANFETKQVCEFYRTQKFATCEICVFSPVNGAGFFEPLKRRKNGEGTLAPGDYCPIWPLT